MTDYPAAHSMDTSWYAVDAAGHVALFESGENGHAPHSTLEDEARPVDLATRHPEAA